jgi:hypothetical protein
MKRRGPLYDTRTYELENKDLTQGVILALATLLLIFYASKNGSAILFSITGVCAYLAALLSSNRTRMLVPVALIFAMLTLPVSVLETVRIALFGASLSLVPKRRVSASSVFALFTLWTIYLNNRYLLGLLGFSLPFAIPVTVHDLTVAFFEVFGLLIVLLLIWSKRFPALLGRTAGEIELSAVVFTLLLLSSLCATALTTTGALYQNGQTLEQLVGLNTRNAAPFLLLALGGLIIPIALSIALSNLLKDFTSKLEFLLTSGGGAISTPRIRDFLKVISRGRELIDSFDQQIRSAELTVKNQAIQFEERERELRGQTLDAQNIAKALALSPVGFLALTGSGAIISSNLTFCTQFNLEDLQDLVGEHFSCLTPKPNMPLKKEALSTFVAGVIADQNELSKGVPLETSLSIDEETFAQVSLYLVEGDLLPVDQKRISPQIRPSNITLLIFTQIRDDSRPFILRQLAPTSLELLAIQSVESLREIHNQIESAQSKVFLSNDKLAVLSQLSADELEAELRIVDRGTKELLTDVRTLAEVILKRTRVTPLSKEESQNVAIEKINLTQHFERLLKLFDELSGQVVATEFIPPALSREDGSEFFQQVTIQAADRLFSRFSSILLATLSAIAKRVPGEKIQLTLGSEQIGTGTSALFRGSHPGRYARIVINHSGQSVTANMMPESVTRLGDPDKLADSLEGILALLSYHVERLHGFFSIQSSPVKGTHLTIYLPEDPRALDLTSKPATRKVPQTHLEPLTEKPIPAAPPLVTPESLPTLAELSVLVVSDHEQVSEELFKQLSECDLTRIEKASSSQVNSASEDISGRSGSGFTEGVSDIFQNGLDLDRFALIVVPIIGDLASGMRLLKTIGHSRPLLIVTDDEDSADALSSIHRVISYPVDRESLRAVIDSLR